MSDNFENGIKQAMDILNNPESLKGILELLGNSQSSGSSRNEASSEGNSESTSGNNQELLQRAHKIIGALNPTKDPWINLLTAVSPFLNNKRQRAVNDCVHLLKVSKVLPIILNNKPN